MEEQCNRLRHELDIIHKKLLSTLEGPKEKATKLNELKPSNKVGSPGRPLVSSDFQHSHTHTLSPATSPAPGDRGDNSYDMNETRGGYSNRENSPSRANASPVMDSSSKGVVSPVRTRSLSPLRIVSPKTERKAYSFREKPNPDHGYNSPRRSFQRHLPPIMSKRSLENFQNSYLQAKMERKQYPVTLVGRDQKQAYLENELFDSDYDSSQSSSQSYLTGRSHRHGSHRRNVQFDRNINVIPHGET